MTDGLLVLVAVFGVALSFVVFRRWGWPAVVGVWTFVAVTLATFWRRERLPLELEAPVTDEAERQAREGNQRLRLEAQEREREAQDDLDAANEQAAALAGLSDQDLLDYANRRAERDL